MKNKHPKKISFIFYLIIGLLFFISCITVSGQSSIDSLLNLLEDCPEMKKAELLNQISSAYWNTSPEQRLHYGQEALNFAKKYEDEFNLAKSYENIAAGYSGLGELDSTMKYTNLAYNLILNRNGAIKDGFLSFAGRLFYAKGVTFERWGAGDSAAIYYSKAGEIFKREGDNFKLAHIYIRLGLIASTHGSNYEKAVNYYLQAMQIGEKNNYLDVLSYAYHNLAIVYNEWGNLEKSLEFFLKSYELNKEHGNLTELGDILNSLGLINIMLGDTVAGIEYYNEAIEMEESINDKLGKAFVQNNLGLIYCELKKYSLSERYLEKALQIGEELHTAELLVDVHKSYFKLYQKMGDFSRSAQHLEKSQQAAASAGITIDFLDNYYNYYQLYSKQKNYIKALEYFEKYSALKDSLFTSEKHKQITELETKYETERQIEKNILLEKENEVTSLQLKKSRIFLYSVIIIIILGILLFTIVFYSFRRRQKNKQLILQKESELKISEMEKRIYSTEVEVQEKERKRFAKDLHDGLGPLLSSLNLYINKITGSNTSDLITTTKEILREAITNTRNIAHDIMPIAIAEQDLIESINKFIFRIKKSSSINFTVNCEKKLPNFDQPEKLVLFRVITELINNTIKHAHADKVTISIDSNDSSTSIRYSDNGIGFNKENLHAGLGIKNINDNIKSIGGDIEIKGNEGKGMEAIVSLKSKL